MRTLILTLAVVVLSACPHQEARPFTGTIPKDITLDLAGTFTLLLSGELRLALAKPCIVERGLGTSRDEITCTRARLDLIRVVAHTPWNLDIPGTWLDASHLVFQVDWKNSGLDPLAEDSSVVVTRSWDISGTHWDPTPAEAAAILKLVSKATETETEVVHGGPAPSLEVTTFEVDGGPLRSGKPSTLIVRIANRGPGTAYRVAATTRSSITALHGRRLSFGTIKPGADKVRRLEVTVPTSETAPDTMMVLVLTEGNGFAPGNASRRISIALSEVGPKLGVRCTFPGHSGARPDLASGESLSVSCVVDNTGETATKAVDLEVSIAGGKPARSQTQAIAVAGHATFEVPISIPRDIPIDALVEIMITAHDHQFSRTASTKLAGTVRKAKLCVPGKLTRAQYNAKLKELRDALAGGDITQAQFNRYDAELVSCL